MAKQRFINTKFWDDGWIITLDPTEKLLFLYLITNPITTIAGSYEISPRRIAFDTGIEASMVSKILKRFEAAGKIVYRDGWMLVRNFIKNQSNNPKVGQGIESAVNSSPDWVKDTLSKPIDSLSSPLGYLDSDSDLDIDLDENTQTPAANQNSSSGKKKRKPCVLPDDFVLTEKMREWAIENVPTLDIWAEFEQFCDRCRSSGKEYADWDAGWRTQMRNAVKWDKNPKPVVTVTNGKPKHVQPLTYADLGEPTLVVY